MDTAYRLRRRGFLEFLFLCAVLTLSQSRLAAGSFDEGLGDKVWESGVCTELGDELVACVEYSPESTGLGTRGTAWAWSKLSVLAGGEPVQAPPSRTEGFYRIYNAAADKKEGSPCAALELSFNLNDPISPIRYKDFLLFLIRIEDLWRTGRVGVGTISNILDSLFGREIAGGHAGLLHHSLSWSRCTRVRTLISIDFNNHDAQLEDMQLCFQELAKFSLNAHDSSGDLKLFLSHTGWWQQIIAQLVQVHD